MLELLDLDLSKNSETLEISDLNNLKKSLQYLKLRNPITNLTDCIGLFSNGMFSKLIGLCIIQCERISNELLIAITRNCPMLESLELDLNIGRNYSLSQNIGIVSLSNLLNLKTLKLANAKLIKPKSWMELFQDKHLKLLQVLDLSECQGMTNEVLHTISMNCTNLQFLKLDFNQSEVDNISSLSILHQLKALELKFLHSISNNWNA